MKFLTDFFFSVQILILKTRWQPLYPSSAKKTPPNKRMKKRTQKCQMPFCLPGHEIIWGLMISLLFFSNLFCHCSLSFPFFWQELSRAHDISKTLCNTAQDYDFFQFFTHCQWSANPKEKSFEKYCPPDTYSPVWRLFNTTFPFLLWIWQI